MNKIVFGILLLISCNIFAQNPVKWEFSSKKTADKLYEVTLTATIQSGWHLYSQKQPSDAVNMPTEIVFKANPLVTLDGKPKETGKMELFKDKTIKASANQYSGKVIFTQKVKLKASVKTNVVGTIEYQTCNDVKCLPPVKQAFTISLK